MVYLIFSLILFPYGNCVVEDLFAFNVDELFSSMIGPVYKVRRTGHTMPTYNFDSNNYTRSPYPGVTAHSIYHNKSEEPEVPELKRKLDLEFILNDEVSGKPNFEVDEIQTLSRRFDKALGKNKPDKPILREIYHDVLDDIPKLKSSKYLVSVIIQHFLYQTRYKMPYAQKMRQEYMPRIRYKIGYGFSLLRVLHIKQRVLYTAMKRNMGLYDNPAEFIKIFQKVIRLDLELKDMIRTIKLLDAERIRQFAEAKISINKVREIRRDGGEKETK